MLDMHSPNITNHVINQGWICLCGRKHGAPHVEHLFTFKTKITPIKIVKILLLVILRYFTLFSSISKIKRTLKTLPN